MPHGKMFACFLYHMGVKSLSPLRVLEDWVYQVPNDLYKHSSRDSSYYLNHDIFEFILSFNAKQKN